MKSYYCVLHMSFQHYNFVLPSNFSNKQFKSMILCKIISCNIISSSHASLHRLVCPSFLFTPKHNKSYANSCLAKLNHAQLHRFIKLIASLMCPSIKRITIHSFTLLIYIVTLSLSLVDSCQPSFYSSTCAITCFPELKSL